MLSRKGEQIFKKILGLKKQGIIKKIGFSVYFPNQVKKILGNYDLILQQRTNEVLKLIVKKA